MSELPAGWTIASLSDVATITMGQSPPGTSYNTAGDGVPFFQGKAEFTDMYPDVRKFTTAGTKFADRGDILMSVRAPVGPTNVAPSYCAIGRGLAAIRANDDVEPRFLLWALRASSQALAGKASGSTFPAITGSQLRQHSLRIPPFEEQGRIVAVLETQLVRLDVAERALRSGLARGVALRTTLISAATSGTLPGAR